MVPREFLKIIATKVGISDNELEVMARAIQGEPMTSISKQLGVRKDALQKRLGEVYRKLDIGGAGPGKLAKLQQRLLSEYQQQLAANARNLGNVPPHLQPPVPLPSVQITQTLRTPVEVNWDHSPELSSFYGRTHELLTLQQWLVDERCRLVVLSGMGGIGKTALATEVVQKIAPDFKKVIWRSLLEQPLVDELLTDWLQVLSDSEPDELPTKIDQQISELMQLLSNSRYLFVLDDVQSLMASGEKTKLSESYDKLFQHLVQHSHQSSFILISSDPLKNLVSLPTKKTNQIRFLELKGLAEHDAQKVLLNGKIFTDSEQGLLSELINLYGSNPLILKLLSPKLSDASIESLTKFIKQNTLVMEEIVRQFLKADEEISELETRILCWLVINPKPCSVRTLALDLMLTERREEVQEAVEFLQEQSFLEKTNAPTETYILSSHFHRRIMYSWIGKSFNEMGYKKYLNGEFQSAKFDLSQAVRYAPDLIAAHYNLGATYEKLDQYEEAQQHYQQIMEVENNRASHAAVNHLARLEILDGKLETAIDKLQKTLSQTKDKEVKATLHKNLGWAYFLSNHYDRAKSHLDQSLDLKNNQPSSYYLLAQVLEEKGEEKQALISWKTALEQDESDRKSNGVTWRLPEIMGWRMMARQRLLGLK